MVPEIHVVWNIGLIVLWGVLRDCLCVVTLSCLQVKMILAVMKLLKHELQIKPRKNSGLYSLSSVHSYDLYHIHRLHVIMFVVR